MAGMSPKISRRRQPYSKIKVYLYQNNIPQVEVGVAIGKTSSAINQKLNGTGGDFSLNEARALCEKFGIPKEFFFELDVPIKEHNELDGE
ncbi:XRE family transcriptional regulator [Paenibacillus sp. HN-1]|uniref:XRE family transcriptional regulator n=1 Tax=Paenibacillus TaxID=44249 RepID=UPI001CA922C6|nr:MULTISPECIES: XRE family transcriptional regulator [Paenibacillus]MBY9077246.1 XRE family transcriptional regulator [Paenibacillus sp. CGMCC 1.18879]MBY9083293.1 XRE family transcriptional regulator [Paenibacillus sinensis]